MRSDLLQSAAERGVVRGRKTSGKAARAWVGHEHLDKNRGKSESYAPVGASWGCSSRLRKGNSDHQV